MSLLTLSMSRVHRYVKGISRRLLSTMAENPVYTCDADVEPLYRYRPGGYHPIHIGDTLADRYTILHKLGWGGFSTVWAVRDLREQKCFALKAEVSEKQKSSREIEIMQAIASSKSRNPGLEYLLSLHDHFQLHGPNGEHNCLIFDITGASIPDTIEQRFGSGRLPRSLAKRFTKQVTLGIACLHQQGISHADLHTRNIVLSDAAAESFSSPAWWQRLGQAQIEPVRRKDQQPIGLGVPKYLVRPVSLTSETLSLCSAKITDFGEAFSQKYNPGPSHTPLVVRAPEAIFNDRIDLQADLWSLGCVLFELATGQPPFDSIMATPVSLIEQILETTGEVLPLRWQSAWLRMADGQPFVKQGLRLQEWLEEVYFDGEVEAEFSREDIKNLGRVIQKLLRLEPTERTSAEEILKDPWFQDP